MNTDLIEKFLRERHGWDQYPLQIQQIEEEEEREKEDDTQSK